MWIEEGKSWEKMDNSKVAAVLKYQDKQGIKLSLPDKSSYLPINAFLLKALSKAKGALRCRAIPAGILIKIITGEDK